MRSGRIFEYKMLAENRCFYINVNPSPWSSVVDQIAGQDTVLYSSETDTNIRNTEEAV